LVDGLIARHAIALLSRDTRTRRYASQRFAAILGKSSTPPVQSDAPLPG
jgi:hypothetical protein